MSRDASQRALGCMQQGGHVEVCHSRAPVGPATPSGLGCNQSAGQGRQTCPAKGKVYVGEMQRCLETRVKEHWDACNKGDTWKSAIAEHQWDQQHQVDWDATRVLDRAARPVQLKVKEALHIDKTLANNRLNRDGGYELPAVGSRR